MAIVDIDDVSVVEIVTLDLENDFIPVENKRKVKGSVIQAALKVLVDANTAKIERDNTRQTLATSGSLTWDADLGLRAITTLDGAATLPLITNVVATDHDAEIIVKQDGIGGRTLDTSAYKKPGGVLTLSTSPNAVDLISIRIESPSIQYIVAVKNLS